ncbi:hypothetical protein FVE85_2940 [Porphyridium purpureum]|uniref:Glycolipid transfer protein domain-containing protein n=1 Tax=Porphyridium purpureum TaxID=35688 RepID=A0A5J4YT98_PORPP|nr:hypothetical protein FVE85_2940 [Porphyridium purpureum]|eukprot:POR6092..scf227_4
MSSGGGSSKPAVRFGRTHAPAKASDDATAAHETLLRTSASSQISDSGSFPVSSGSGGRAASAVAPGGDEQHAKKEKTGVKFPPLAEIPDFFGTRKKKPANEEYKSVSVAASEVASTSSSGVSRNASPGHAMNLSKADRAVKPNSERKVPPVAARAGTRYYPIQVEVQAPAYQDFEMGFRMMMVATMLVSSLAHMFESSVLAWVALVLAIVVMVLAAKSSLDDKVSRTVQVTLNVVPKNQAITAQASEGEDKSATQPHSQRPRQVAFSNVTKDVDEHVADGSDDEESGTLEKRASRMMDVIGCDQLFSVVKSRSGKLYSPAPAPSLSDADPKALWLAEQNARYQDFKAENDQQRALLKIKDLWLALELKSSGDFRFNQFNEALLSLGAVIDAFGTALVVIKMDWSAKCGAIETACVRAGTEYVHPMVWAEVAKKGPPGLTGSDGILWMKRTLQFIVSMISGLTLGGVDLGEAVEFAYRETLYHVHPYLVQKLAGNIKRAVPTRDTFIQRLYPDEGFVTFKLREFSYIMRPKLDMITAFLNEAKVETVLTQSADHFHGGAKKQFAAAAASAPTAAVAPTAKPKHRRTKTIG